MFGILLAVLMGVVALFSFGVTISMYIKTQGRVLGYDETLLSFQYLTGVGENQKQFVRTDLLTLLGDNATVQVYIQNHPVGSVLEVWYSHLNISDWVWSPPDPRRDSNMPMIIGLGAGAGLVCALTLTLEGVLCCYGRRTLRSVQATTANTASTILPPSAPAFYQRRHSYSPRSLTKVQGNEK